MATDSHDSHDSHADQTATEIEAAPDDVGGKPPAAVPSSKGPIAKSASGPQRQVPPPRGIDDPTGVIEPAPALSTAKRSAPLPSLPSLPSVQGGKPRKFLESSTQLQTAIYNSDATLPEADPIPEHVSRVLQKAEELLASLGPDFSDETAILRKPAPKPPNRQPTGSVDVAFDDNRGAKTVPAAPEDLPHVDPPEMDAADLEVPELDTDDFIDVDEDMSDMTQSLRGRQSEPLRAETATEVAEAFDFSRPGVTLPGQGAPAPLSSEPISPGPASPKGVNLHTHADGHASSDGMATLSTELPDPMALGPNGARGNQPLPSQPLHPNQNVNPFQPRAALASPPRRSALRSLFASVKRLFGGAPPAPPMPAPIAEEEDEIGYGAGTYTVANRLVAQSRRPKRSRRPPPPSRPPNTSPEGTGEDS